MKIIFFSQDGQIKRLAESLSGDVVIAESQEEVLELLEDVDEDDQCLIFLDFDQDKKAVEKFNKKICSNEWILRIILSGEMKVKDFRKHQKGKTSAHGYVLKPLSGKVLKTILNDLEVSNIIEEKELYEEGTKLPDLPKEVSSLSGFDSADEFLAEDDDEEFEAAEFGMNTEVRNLVDLHSVKGNGAPFDGPLNEAIQAKFDQVFGSYEDEEDVGEADSSFMGGGPGGGMDLTVKDETNESISLDLGASDDDGGAELDLGGDGDDGADLDLGGDSDDDEVDLSADEDELDLSADDDSEEEIDLGGGDEELDLSGDDEEEIDLGGGDEEIDLSADDDDEEIDLGGGDDELDLSADDEEIDLSAEDGDMEQELEDLTANRELPSPEELSEFDEETGDMEISTPINNSDATGTAEVNAADSDLGEGTSEELSMSDDNDDVLEFDTEDTQEEEGELSFSTEPEDESPTQDSEEEGGLDFDLGGMDDEGELETSAPATSESSDDEEEGGFDLGGDDDDSFSLETGAVASEEGTSTTGEDTGGMEMDLGGDDDDDFVLEAGGESEETSSLSSADDGGMEMDLGGDDEDEFDLGDDAVLEAASDEGEDSAVEIEEDDDELSFDDASEDDDALDQEMDFGAEEDIDLGDDEPDAIEDAVAEVAASSEFDEEELDFAGEEDEELEKTQAVNIADIGELSGSASNDDEEMDFGAEEVEESFDDDLDSDLDGDLDGGDDALQALEDEDDGQFDADEDLLNDDEFGEDTNPTVVMSGDVTRDIEDMVDKPGFTNEFRPGAMESEDDDALDDGLDGLEDEGILSAEEDDEGTEVIEDIPAKVPPPPTPAEGTLNITREEDRHPPVFSEGEAVRLQATIRQLREEREELLKEIQDLKKENKVVEQENLGLKAELDEAKIEISILKKRHSTEMDEMKYRLRISDEKKLYAEEKARKLQKEFDRLQSKVRMDFNHIKQREKELESQLELVKMDSESQVQSRDKKILELKRKIDQLEFNMENIVIREQKSRDDKMRLEERLERIMKTLRGSIEVLEDDIDFEGNKRGRE